MKTASLLGTYRGALTTEQIAVGMNAATANARRLAQDARLLLGNERWATAASIAALSIEESGKVVILRRFLTANAEDLKVLWKEYRSHTKKNLHWILPDLVAKGARRLEDLRPMVDASSDHPQVLDTMKQLGFYTDCLSNAHWSIPNDVIDAVMAERLVTASEALSPDRIITVRELELWAEHLSPVWNMGRERMEKGLVNWYEAMQKEGLAPPGVNKMENFVKTGLTEVQSVQMTGE